METEVVPSRRKFDCHPGPDASSVCFAHKHHQFRQSLMGSLDRAQLGVPGATTLRVAPVMVQASDKKAVSSRRNFDWFPRATSERYTTTGVRAGASWVFQIATLPTMYAMYFCSPLFMDVYLTHGRGSVGNVFTVTRPGHISRVRPGPSKLDQLRGQAISISPTSDFPPKTVSTCMWEGGWVGVGACPAVGLDGERG